MRTTVLLGMTIVCALSLVGCKKRVPNDIVKQSLSSAIRQAPFTSAAMCGGATRGLTSPTISNIKIGENNTGTAHIKGRPWFAKGLPAECEGDVEFSYGYDTKRLSKKRSKTTWHLEHMKLTAVQTPGVQFKSVDESPDDEDDDANAAAAAAASASAAMASASAAVASASAAVASAGAAAGSAGAAVAKAPAAPAKPAAPAPKK